MGKVGKGMWGARGEAAAPRPTLRTRGREVKGLTEARPPARSPGGGSRLSRGLPGSWSVGWAQEPALPRSSLSPPAGSGKQPAALGSGRPGGLRPRPAARSGREGQARWARWRPRASWVRKLSEGV